jgi:hypothetical protein
MSEERVITSVEDTRLEPRFQPSVVPNITSVRLSPGDVVELVNISRSGLLVQGRTRFVPGTSVTVYFEGGFTPAQLKGKIVRCQVSSIVGGTLQYQSGIHLDTLIDVETGRTAQVHQMAAAPATSARTQPAPPKPRPLVNRW